MFFSLLLAGWCMRLNVTVCWWHGSLLIMHTAQYNRQRKAEKIQKPLASSIQPIVIQFRLRRTFLTFSFSFASFSIYSYIRGAVVNNVHKRRQKEKSYITNDSASSQVQRSRALLNSPPTRFMFFLHRLAAAANWDFCHWMLRLQYMLYTRCSFPFSLPFTLFLHIYFIFILSNRKKMIRSRDNTDEELLLLQNNDDSSCCGRISNARMFPNGKLRFCL